MIPYPAKAESPWSYTFNTVSGLILSSYLA